MDRNQLLQLIHTHGADVTIGALAMGTMAGWTYCIIGAGIVAGVSIVTRMRRGEFMEIVDQTPRLPPAAASESASTR